MSDEELFKPILDNDEKVIEIFKPNMFRFVWLPFFVLLLFMLIPLVPGIIMVVSNAIYEGIVFLVVAFAFIFFYPLIGGVRFSKTAYCYTNKRVIIRTGFIGVDYQAIDYDLIGAMNVRVDMLDKFVKPNTGTIIFASAASPIVNNAQASNYSAYAFRYIQNPYDVYKRVKEYSSKNKDGQFNS